MTSWRNWLALLAGITAFSADWSKKNAAELEAMAVEIASANRPADLADLARQLSNAGFLHRLDPEPNSLNRLAQIFRALAAHPAPASAALCLQLADSKAFASFPARWNLLLPALAAVRPMTPKSARLFQETSRNGLLEVTIPLLASNATPEALKAMELLFTDESQSPAQRVAAAHWGLLPNRLHPGVPESCTRILAQNGLAPAVDAAIIESLFDNRPADWFGKRTPYPVPPPWNDGTPTVRAAYQSLAQTLLRRPNLPAHLRHVIENTQRQLGPR